MLEKQFGDALRLGLAEHEAWKAERSILRFYRDFKFHEEVAEEEFVYFNDLRSKPANRAPQMPTWEI